MTSIFSYMLTFMGIIFWLVRTVIAVMEYLGKAFICTTLNLNIEIIVIFATLICFLFVIKRNLIGAAFYLGINGAYFGTALFNSLMKITDAEYGLATNTTIDLLLAVMGILIPLFTFLDILINKNRKNTTLNSKVGWFYDNEQFDRKFDERADRNEYKIK